VKVIVGLGNPGDRYKGTRHNAGFMVTGKLAAKLGIEGKFESKFNAVIGKGKFHDEDVIIVQPLTYMNLSGESVLKVLNWFKGEPEDIFIVFDDINIDFGRIRFRPSGSEGGHNGVKSIIESLGGFNNIPRLKVGIGPDPGGAAKKNYVLQEFSQEEKNILDEIIDTCVEAIEFYMINGMEKTRCRYNCINVLKSE